MTAILDNFEFTQWPKIHYGSGVTQNLKTRLDDLETVLWVTGGKKGTYSAYFKRFLELTDIQIPSDNIVQIGAEPSPSDIDEISRKFQNENHQTKITKVIAIGGGSVLDAGKALAAMLMTEHSLLDYLEGVGKGLPLPDHILPFIAIPTTSGTGSEMTSNAVFSQVGNKGFKKSIRHDKLIPTEIWLDARLTMSCPPLQTACCGLDAFTQLLESYLSTKSSLITDTLAEKGLELIIRNLIPACTNKADDPDVRGELAIAAMLSGSCLANAGLGIVHGIAGPMGGLYEIPHGVACAGLIAEANQTTLDALIKNDDSSQDATHAIHKMAKIGRMCTQNTSLEDSSLPANKLSDMDYCQILVDTLFAWQKELNIPKFYQYGLRTDALDDLVRSSSNRNNPAVLSKAEIKALITACI
ncbi:iron-containing alcohol dehydrogenase [Marinomonas sp. PE14-40]|uniref:iron-containing alcohol dehydrogenase n=1 Tax=Marinomonas sp. PE14-40 TaxID=3060621 RepID=UPI003F670303